MSVPAHPSVLESVLQRLGVRRQQLDPSATAGFPASLVRALDLMEQVESTTTARLAKEIGVSTRALQYAFHDHLSMTPMAVFRRVRLERAHRDLARPEVGSGIEQEVEHGADCPRSVAAIAARHGFHHPGRFAAAHREVYGELPGDLLGRSAKG